MLTPQEVSERSFTKATFGGYNMSQVDEFLDILTQDYSALYSENAVLKSKMKVLVDKVEEYRSTEEAMRKALMTAQRMADELVAEAEQKKKEVLQQAEAEARRQLGELTAQVEAEEYRLRQAQQSTAAFVAQVRAAQAKQEELLAHLAELCPADAAPVRNEDKVDEAVSEIDDNVQRLLAQAISDATAENLRAREDEEPRDLSDTAEFTPCKDEAPAQPAAPVQQQEAPRSEEDDLDDMMAKTSRIDFGDLQFGRDYRME